MTHEHSPEGLAARDRVLGRDQTPAASTNGDQPPPAPHPADTGQEPPAPATNGPGRLPDPHEPAPLDLGPAHTLRIVSAEAFAAVDEDGADPLLGDADEVLIPENGDVMIYGDGGAGKTTLATDLGAHLAAGDDWLGISVPRQLTVLVIEDEGPRPLFRAKVRSKLAAWDGSPIGGRLRIVEEPWATFTFANEGHRQALAAAITDGAIDVVIVGPVTCAGMDDAGTLQETRAFAALLADVRRRAGRHVTFVLIHHEGKSGKVSGAWEGTGDTLLHVTGLGHGRTRLYVQKARWAAAYHATTLNLRWTDGAGFEVEEKPELDEDALAEQIIATVADAPGIGWTKVEEATPGVSKHRRREIRDRLLTDGQLVNVATIDGVEVTLNHCPERRPAHLHLADDPTISHLRPAPGADGAQLRLAGGEGDQRSLRPAPRPIRAQGVGAADAPPDDPGFETPV